MAGFPEWWINPLDPVQKERKAIKMLETFATLVIDEERKRLASQFLVDSSSGKVDITSINSIHEYIKNGGI